jgi:hypothetical protein
MSLEMEFRIECYKCQAQLSIGSGHRIYIDGARWTDSHGRERVQKTITQVCDDCFQQGDHQNAIGLC